MNNTSNNTSFKFSYFQIESVKYIYKIRKQKGKTADYNYTVKTSDVTDSVNNVIQNSHMACDPDRLTLYQNFTDNSGAYVAIKFFLPKSAKTKIIFLNSDKTEALYLINKKLEAGFHTLVTDIKNEELQSFEYYMKLKAGRNTDVKKMRFITIS